MHETARPLTVASETIRTQIGETTEAVEKLTKAFIRSVQNSGGFCPAEGDRYLNDASRNVIEAMAEEHGGCWLGRVNLHHRNAADDGNDENEPINWDVPLWQWSGKPVCDFGADFVLPQHDAHLERLIRERDSAAYTGTADDYVRVETIHARLAEVGGVHLHWS